MRLDALIVLALVQTLACGGGTGISAGDGSLTCDAGFTVMCADAGQDAMKDAMTDAADGLGCDATDGPLFCAIAHSTFGDITVCDDQAFASVCQDGQRRCPGAATVDTRRCTCSGLPFPGCGTCTKTGWKCTDASTDGS